MVSEFEELEGKRKMSGCSQIEDGVVDDISHEIRTPLTAIKGFTELLLNSQNLNNTQHNDLQIILKNIIRLERALYKFEYNFIRSII